LYGKVNILREPDSLIGKNDKAKERWDAITLGEPTAIRTE
jgi:hypothetical protein